MKAVVVALLLVVVQVCGCRPGYFSWESAEGRSPSREKLRDDIFECERYAEIDKMDGDSWNWMRRPSRDFGGWGDFDFEFCMRERGWRLRYHPGPRAID